MMTEQMKIGRSLYKKQIKLQEQMAEVQLEMMKRNPQKLLEFSNKFYNTDVCSLTTPHIMCEVFVELLVYTLCLYTHFKQLFSPFLKIFIFHRTYNFLLISLK